MKKNFWILASALALGACGDRSDPVSVPMPLVGQRVYAIDNGNNLVLFGSGSPGTISRRSAISGLQSGEQVVGIDFRPTVGAGIAATEVGALFGLTSSSRLIRIDTATAQATVVSTISGGTVSGTAFGFDFNPSVDRIRVTSDTRQNLRLNQTASPVATTVDTVLAYVTGDPGAGANASLAGSAYTPASLGSSTTLFGIDFARDVLIASDRPNGGTLRTVTALPVNTTGDVGFDIGSDGVGFVALTTAGSNSQLFRLNSLSTSVPVFTLIGSIGATIRALAIAP